MRSSKRTLFGVLLVIVGTTPILTGAAVETPNPTDATETDIPAGCYFYDDSVTWDSWSWGGRVEDGASPAWQGEQALAVTFERGWAGVGLKSSPLSTEPYSHLQFAVRPSGGDFPRLTAAMADEAGPIKEVQIAPYARPDGDGWHWVSIPLEELEAAETAVRAVKLKDATGKGQSTFHLDSVRLAGPENGEVGYPPCEFRPLEASGDIDQNIHEAVERYNMPRWFYYAIIQRESSFDPKKVGPRNDLGLTQLKGAYYTGRPYPMYLREPDDEHHDYVWAMNIPGYGAWISMREVSRMTDPFDPEQNLERFSTGYAVPAFHLFKEVYGLDDEETLRAVAFHWNKGVHRTYDPGNKDYLELYDRYVEWFKAPVEAQDGVWDGEPRLR